MLDGIGGVGGDMARARQEAQLALQLDPTLPEPHAALAFAFMIEGRFAESAAAYQRALALNPNYSMARFWHANLLSCQGRLDAALREQETVVTLDPLSFIMMHRHAELLAFGGRPRESLRVHERGAALRAEAFVPGQADRAMALLAAGDRAGAIQLARSVRASWPQKPRWYSDSCAVWVLRQGGKK